MNNRPGGAVWCDEHSRWECSKTRKTARGGGRCHRIAITGTDACPLHAGVATAVAKAKGEAVTAWSAMDVDVNAAIKAKRAVLGMLQISWLRAHLYSELLRRQMTHAAAEIAGDETADGGGGLVGHTYGSSKDGVYATGEAPRGLVLIEERERDRCVRYAKVAHDIGIDEEQIRLAEGQGALLAAALRGILGDLGLSPDQWALVPSIVPRHLRAARTVEEI